MQRLGFVERLGLVLEGCVCHALAVEVESDIAGHGDAVGPEHRAVDRAVPLEDGGCAVAIELTSDDTALPRWVCHVLAPDDQGLGDAVRPRREV